MIGLTTVRDNGEATGPQERGRYGQDERIDEYRLVRPLGSPPNDDTFLAHDIVLDRPVVVSFLTTRWGVRSSHLRQQGASAIAKVQHPNLCRIHRIRGGPTPYVVSDYVRGVKLTDTELPFDLTTALDVGCGLVSAVAALHAADVTHGAIQPSTVVIDRQGEPRLIGMSLATRHNPNHGRAARRADVRAVMVLLSSLVADQERQALLGHWALTFEDADSRLPTAAELLHELQRLRRRKDQPAATMENPYRGLAPHLFEHSLMFFGRQHEQSAILARLRDEALLLIAGSSGVGKSSLVRAGLAPPIAAGALGGSNVWDVVTMTPGSRPLLTLAAFFAPHLGESVAGLHAFMERNPRILGTITRRRERGLLFVVDQLEELVTLAASPERDLFVRALDGLAALDTGVRTLITVRSDYVGKLSAIPAFVESRLPNSLFTLFPLSPQALRDVIVMPARSLGVELETTRMVDVLVAEAAAAGVAMLSFVMAELWEARDRIRRVIPEEILRRQGGIAGTIARHGDQVLAAMTAGERGEAQRLLLLLTSADGICRPFLEARLLEGGNHHTRSALEALVKGRLVTAIETGPPDKTIEKKSVYRLAHGTLVDVWPQLRAWIDEVSGERTAALGLIAAALEWHRLGRGSEYLYGKQQLARLPAKLLHSPHLEACLRTNAWEPWLAAHGEYQQEFAESYGAAGTGALSASSSPAPSASSSPPAPVALAAATPVSAGAAVPVLAPVLVPDQVPDRTIVEGFLASSRAAVRAKRWHRPARIAAVPVMALLGIAVVWTWNQVKTTVDASRELARARELVAAADREEEELVGLRGSAFRYFDSLIVEDGERRWRTTLAKAASVDERRTAACSYLAGVLHDPSARALHAGVLLARILAAERDHQPVLRRALTDRLALVDPGGARTAGLDQPTRVRARTEPAGALLILHRFREDGSGKLALDALRSFPSEDTMSVELAAGSYVLAAELEGRYSTRYPFRVSRGEELELVVVLPNRTAVPPGYAYVPRGKFLYGSREAEAVRRAFGAPPEHEVELDAFLIAQHLVTWREILAYWKENGDGSGGGLLQRDHAGRARLILPGGIVFVEGEPFCPSGGDGSCLEWQRLPAQPVSWRQAQEYASWLAHSGRLPNARLCSDREWERALRGADERRFPGGSQRAETQKQRELLACAGALFVPSADTAALAVPAERSPFGVDDLAAGGVSEWVDSLASLARAHLRLQRGSACHCPPEHARDCRTAHDPRTRPSTSAFRICASLHKGD
ncbi:MAG: SUMF1/EgtB/PvdO family nonheme iron enzyme [Pseudomonadota bacterium]